MRACCIKAAGRYDFNSYLDYLFDHRESMATSRAIIWAGTVPRSWRNISRAMSSIAAYWSEAKRLREDCPQSSAVPSQCRTKTATSPRPEITSAQRAKLERIYPGDLVLYEWVSEN